jgi:hypothetical protein
MFCVLRRQCEPFSVAAPICEPIVPVHLNTWRVIGTNRVQQSQLLGQLDCKFVFAPPQRSRAPNFVVFAHARKVHESQRRIGVGLRLLARFAIARD